MRKNMIKKIAFSLVLLSLGIFVFSACKKNYVEEYYSGTVVGIELCSTRTNGYLVDLKMPDSIGDTMTIGKKFYKNVVIAYEVPAMLKEQQKISGVMYKTKGYANLNCMMFDTRNLQEIIILSIEDLD